MGGFSHEKAARRGQDARQRSGNEYRERSPRHSRRPQAQEPHIKSQKQPRNQKDGAETKGLSNKIHSLRRLLEKATDMPADIRQEKERELQGYVVDQQHRQARKEKNAVTSRYHFVRFMERKKADRRLKQLEKKFDTVMMHTDDTMTQENRIAPAERILEEEAGENMGGVDDQPILPASERLSLLREEELERLHEAKVDLNYTLYAPLDQKYIALYASNSNGEEAGKINDGSKAEQALGASAKDDEAGIFRNQSGQKPPLWYEVEKAMENGTLEALRDGKLPRADPGAAPTLTFRSMAGPAKGKKVPGLVPDSGGGVEGSEVEGSDDDFFER